MLLRSRHSLGLRLMFALGAMGLFALGYLWGNQFRHGGAMLPTIGGVLVRPAGSLPGFELRDTFGRVFDRRRLDRSWSLLAFGDLSSASGQRAAQRLIDAYNRVADQAELRKDLQLVLVSTRDAPALARDFSRLSPALQVVTGPSEDIARLSASLGSASTSEPSLFLLGPGAYLVALFPPTQTGGTVAEDLKAIVANAAAILPEEP